jgi:hypothetical protein
LRIAILDRIVGSTMIRLLIAVLAISGIAAGESITLQQGVNNYQGCSIQAMEETRPVDSADDSYLRLRGSRYSLHIKFDDDPHVAPIRARLMIFLASARNANRFTEIFCHAAITGGRQLSYDEVTNYDNGHRRGAVDSVELFAPGHEGWPNFPFLPLGVPNGGRWIEFNITPVLEKWISAEEKNNGVLLIPTDPPDRRVASTWEIDVPTAKHPNAEMRPKLVLDYGNDVPGALIGITSSLERISDRSTRFAYRGKYHDSYRMSMAAGETEGFQVVVYPMRSNWTGVRLKTSDLTSPTDEKIPAADIQYFVEDTFQLRRNWMTNEMFAGKLYEMPDPLLPAKPISLRRQVHTPFYVSIKTRPKTPAGIYRGKLTVVADGLAPRDIGLEVKVWPYAIPTRWNFHTMGQFVWDTVERFHGASANKDLFNTYYEFLLAHRFTPTEEYRAALSPRMRLAELLRRGVNTIYLNGNFSGSEQDMEQVRRDYEVAKSLKALDYTLIYIGDETDKWDDMRRRANLIHTNFPGVLVMIGGSLPRPELLGYIDVYDPHISGGNKIYSLEQDQAQLIAESQARGEEFYWYTAAGPSYPHPNVQLENR